MANRGKLFGSQMSFVRSIGGYSYCRQTDIMRLGKVIYTVQVRPLSRQRFIYRVRRRQELSS